MKSLFIDTTNNKIVFIYLINNDIKGSAIIQAKNRISEIIDDELKQFLIKQNVSLSEIKTFYVTKGPGTFTGVRIGLSIVKTIWTINSDIKVYSINTMQLMAGVNDINVAIDARGGKHFYSHASNGQLTTEIKLISNDELPVSNLITNLDEIDYVKNFIEIKDKFLLESNIDEFNPIYLKKVI